MYPCAYQWSLANISSQLITKSACNHYTSRKVFKYSHRARPTSCQSFWENNCAKKEDNKVFIIQTSITAPTDHAPKLERGPLLLPLLCLTHHPQSQESPLHIIKMSLPSNKHITVWLQLPLSPALTATVSTIPLHRSPNPSLPLSSTPDQPSNKSNSMSENSVVRTDNLPNPGSGEITRCQTRKGEVVRHCKELVHSGFVQHLQHHAHSSSTWKRETFTSYFLCMTCNPKNLRVLWPFSFLCTISYTYDPSSNPITL